VAFAFDIRRRAILLVAGNKSGISERRSYRELIRKADDRFDAYLARQKGARVIMPVDVNDKISKLSPTLRKKVEARAAELIAEEMTLGSSERLANPLRSAWPRLSGNPRQRFAP
jgi:hypothetical protein